MELTLEIFVLPVTDVDRTKAFYTGLGFRLDADFTTDRGLRVVQVTPPGAGTASIIFGDKLTTATPGSTRGLHLVTPDLANARSELLARGAAVSEIWHDADGVFHWAGDANRVTGPSPDHDSYASYASFADPDGNEWILQQVINRLPGR
ncbi:VOC family protein [Microbacterium sp. Au-Mic1]|uniref:VOC family protein n=1 Tax=Microbacterium sp. Au-Mic1 TaxID=2906457 RepID=UPI001E3B7789|nr:VOC family protein [Microbacterium sp. Au-Mic1]MCE4027189.1 VOC family protein [Microbacterium sp. Au-Mic1]